MAAADTLTFLEKQPFFKLFNRGGYVLDFSTERFDDFTQESVGVKLCEKYGFSKGHSFEKFISEASSDQAWKLLTDLLTYYKSFYMQKDNGNRQYQNLYQQCLKLITDNSDEHVDKDNSAMYFNIIIRADESSPVERKRVFEDTDPTVASQFKYEDGTPNFELLRQLPTIASPEYDDSSSATAQIGYLGTGPSQCLEAVVASFPVTKLNHMLSFSKWKGSRTRWIVLRGDPYRMLGDLRNNYKPIQNPAVIRFPTIAVNDRQIAVMMPFNTTAYLSPLDDPVYRAVKEAANQLGYECKRVDEIKTPTDITQDILELIESSRVVIADLSGANPNVYYEMGLAHARGRIVIPISSDGEKLPFDNSHIRTIFYHKGNKYSLLGLTEDIKNTLENL